MLAADGLKFPLGSKVLAGDFVFFGLSARSVDDLEGLNVEEGRPTGPGLVSLFEPPLLDFPGVELSVRKLLDGLPEDGAKVDDFLSPSSEDEKLKLLGGPEFFFDASDFDGFPDKFVGSKVLLGRPLVLDVLLELFLPLLPFDPNELDGFCLSLPVLLDFEGLNPPEPGGVNPLPPDLLESPNEKLGGRELLFLLVAEKELLDELGGPLLFLFRFCWFDFFLFDLFLGAFVS